MVKSAILTFDGPQVARVRAYVVKISFLKGFIRVGFFIPRESKMSKPRK